MEEIGFLRLPVVRFFNDGSGVSFYGIVPPTLLIVSLTARPTLPCVSIALRSSRTLSFESLSSVRTTVFSLPVCATSDTDLFGVRHEMVAGKITRFLARFFCSFNQCREITPILIVQNLHNLSPYPKKVPILMNAFLLFKGIPNISQVGMWFHGVLNLQILVT